MNWDQTLPIGSRARARSAVPAAALWLAVTAAALADAAEPPSVALRQLANLTHYDHVTQQAVALLLPGTDRVQVLGRHYAVDWSAVAGTLRAPDGSTAFVSIGPGISLRDVGGLRRTSLRLSISPTWIEHPMLGGRDLGGHLHFTSAIDWVFYLDAARQRSIALRLQHTSNAGAADDNPGLDLAGIELGFRFGRRAPRTLVPRRPVATAPEWAPRAEIDPGP